MFQVLEAALIQSDISMAGAERAQKETLIGTSKYDQY